jgi:hypothetical protein
MGGFGQGSANADDMMENERGGSLVFVRRD